jgi:hypothetical protein
MKKHTENRHNDCDDHDHSEHSHHKNKLSGPALACLLSVTLGGFQYAANRVTHSSAAFTEAVHNIGVDGGFYALIAAAKAARSKGKESYRKALLVSAGALAVVSSALAIKESWDDRHKEREKVELAFALTLASVPFNYVIHRRLGHSGHAHAKKKVEILHSPENAGLEESVQVGVPETIGERFKRSLEESHAWRDLVGSGVNTIGAGLTLAGLPPIVESTLSGAVGFWGGGGAIVDQVVLRDSESSDGSDD